MSNNNFTTTILVDQSPAEVFSAVNNVSGWWTENITGDSSELNDEFSVQFGNIHYSKQKLVEVSRDSKIVWLVTDSRLTFVKAEDEWTGNRIVFEIKKTGGQTELRFTQIGLLPEIECYNDCSNAWSGYVNGSLYKLITTGIGEPTRLNTGPGI